MQKIGLMGCGKVAGYGHLPALKESPSWDLISVFEPDGERRQATQERFEVPHAFDNVDAFFESGIDAVTITSPAPCHRQNVRDAVRYGKPILCEKPLAMSEAEAEEMIRLADDAGIMLFTAFMRRFGPEEIKIRSLIQEGAIGNVRSLRMVYIWNCHGRYETDESGNRIEQRRREGRMLEGGPLVDCGVHDIDLARWWLGSEIVGVSGQGAWIQEYEAPDHVFAHLAHENGARTMVEISYSYCHTAKDPVYLFTYDILGTDGVLHFDGESRTLTLRSATTTESFTYPGHKNFAGMYEAFARAVETGNPGDMPTARDGLIATRIAREATDQAIRERNLR